MSELSKKLSNIPRVKLLAALSVLLVIVGTTVALNAKPHNAVKPANPVPQTKTAQTKQEAAVPVVAPSNAVTSSSAPQVQSSSTDTTKKTATSPVVTTIAQPAPSQNKTTTPQTSSTSTGGVGGVAAVVVTPSSGPFGLITPSEIITAVEGSDTGIYTVRTNDGSKVTWRIAGPGVAWEGEVPQKPGPVTVYAIGYDRIVASSISFYIHAEDNLTSAHLGYAEPMFLGVEDVSRGISMMVYSPRFNVVSRD